MNGDKSKTKSIILSETELRRICETLLIKKGISAEDAAIVTDSIAEANLRGIDTHGIAILPTYLKRLEKGAANPKPNIKIEKEGTAFAVYNGDGCLGAIVAKKAMEKAIQEAKNKGIYMCLCRNNNTFGPAFYYSSLATDNNMIGITLCNAPPSMPPWGGKKLLLGTNPISIAVPVKGSCPIILDMATSAAAKSKIYLALEKGESIPLGWALDKDWNPTTKPEEALKGALLPVGGHKGYGLALMVDMLTGVLAGAGSLDEIGSLHHQMDRSQNVGFMFIVINPALVRGEKDFEADVNKLKDKIKSVPKADDIEEVLLPGEKEYKTKQYRLKNGIPVPLNVMNQLDKLLKEKTSLKGVITV